MPDTPDGPPRLYEISGLVRYTAVVCAVSQDDALREVADWESAWHVSGDLLDVLAADVTEVRDLHDPDCDIEEAEDESHSVTRSARAVLPAVK